MCEFDGSRKLDYSLLLCSVSGDKDSLVCCSCSHLLKLLPTPTIIETGNYVDAPQMQMLGGGRTFYLAQEASAFTIITKQHVTVNLYSFHVSSIKLFHCVTQKH